jgi:HJR/Mrr/RecB family endonuclease
MDATESPFWSLVDEVASNLQDMIPDNDQLKADLGAVGAGLLGQKVDLSDRRRAVLNALGKKLRQRLLLAAADRTLKAEQQTRIAALDKRAIRRLQDLAKMDPEDFEYWVAGYFKKRRFRNVVVTQFSHDKGIDIFMKTPKGHEAVAQVKRYNRPIGGPVVQQTLGAMHVAEAEHCYVVTNNRFTRDALAIAQKCPRVVHLIGGAQLLAAA